MVVDTRSAATGVQALSHFVPGGTLLELGAAAAIAHEDQQDAGRQWEELANKLGCSVGVLRANSASLRALAQEENDGVTTALTGAAPSAVGGMVGGALGFVIPIPGASLALGYAGTCIGEACGGGVSSGANQLNVRDIANAIEEKQHHGEPVTMQEAFLLALSPPDRQAIAEEMGRRIPPDANHVTARHILDGIIHANAYRIADKVSQLGIALEPGDNPSEVLAEALNAVNPQTGRKLHPILVLLDHPGDAPPMATQTRLAAKDAGYNGGFPPAPGPIPGGRPGRAAEPDYTLAV